MKHRTAPLGALTALTDDERKALSDKVKDANRRSEQGGGRR